MSVNINWDEILKKEARGINDYDLGEVQEVQSDTVVTKGGYWIKINSFYQRNLRNDSTVTMFGSRLPRKMLRLIVHSKYYKHLGGPVLCSNSSFIGIGPPFVIS